MAAARGRLRIVMLLAELILQLVSQILGALGRLMIAGNLISQAKARVRPTQDVRGMRVRQFVLAHLAELAQVLMILLEFVRVNTTQVALVRIRNVLGLMTQTVFVLVLTGPSAKARLFVQTFQPRHHVMLKVVVHGSRDQR